MARFLLTVLLTAITVLALSQLTDLVRVQGEGEARFANALVFALALGVLNAVVKPVLKILTLPLTLMTLGLFLFVLNAFIFWLATLFPGVGVGVSGFFGAFVGALAVTVVSAIASGSGSR